MTRTLIIDAHPDPASLTSALAGRYAAGAGEEGRTLTLRDLAFDPDLHAGYQPGQQLEPDLVRARELLEWSEHVTVLTPVWWGSVPALLKGFFDRTLEIGWAFRYRESGRPEGLLAGRTGRVVVTSDSPRWYLPLVGDTTVRQVKGRTLEFCGIKPVKVTRCTDVRNASEERRAGWLAECEALGVRDSGQRSVSPRATTTAGPVSRT